MGVGVVRRALARMTLLVWMTLFFFGDPPGSHRLGGGAPVGCARDQVGGNGWGWQERTVIAQCHREAPTHARVPPARRDAADSNNREDVRYGAEHCHAAPPHAAAPT